MKFDNTQSLNFVDSLCKTKQSIKIQSIIQNITTILKNYLTKLKTQKTVETILKKHKRKLATTATTTEPSIVH